MKSKQDKTRNQFQQLLQRQIKLNAELKKTEDQIQELQSQYFQKTWLEGNLKIGWHKNISHQNINHVKIRLQPKDKIFSLSSVTSPANHELNQIIDKNLNPINQARFQSIKKKRIKKKRGPQIRKRSVRRKRR